MTEIRGKKVVLGMSGGVDSSVAAAHLLEAGYDVQGLFMKNWDEDDGTEYCTAIADFEDAQQVADKLGITLHSANFAAEYWDHVSKSSLPTTLRVSPPTLTCCATERSNSSSSPTTPNALAQTI